MKISKNCAIREFTGDCVSVGRCWYYVGDNFICPRHGDVRLVQEYFALTHQLTDDPKLPTLLRQ